MQWQPIETAPRDGTRILATDGVEVSTTHWEDCWACHAEIAHGPGDDGGWTIYDHHEEWNPTHWMPLPPPPGAADE